MASARLDPALYDVAVIGCGPVGATVANLLGQHGLRVLVLERRTTIYDKPRAISSDHEMLRTLQLCGFGEQLASMIAPHPGTVFLGVDGAPIKRLDPLPPPYPLGWLPTATFVQPELEAMLRAGLERFPLVETRLGHAVTGLRLARDHAVVTVQPPEGQSYAVGARFVLACDGANSVVSATLGLAVDDLAFDEWWMIVDAWQRAAAELPATCVQYCWPERPATFIRGPRDLRRWEIKLLPGEDPAAFGALENVRRQLTRFADPAALEVWRVAVYRFHALVARDWRAGPVFLLGDAAHQTPPFMGQGLCAGIRDALNLAWKLAAVLQGRAGEDLLDTYQAERKPHFRTVVERTKALGEIIGELDPAAAANRDARLRAEMASGAAVSIRQRLIPDLTAGLVDLDRGGGALSVQPMVQVGADVMLLDDAVPPGWLLVTAGADEWLDATAAACWQSLAGSWVVVGAGPVPQRALARPEVGSLLQQWLAERGAAAVILRPDKIVYAMITDKPALHRVLAALCQRLRPADTLLTEAEGPSA